MKYKKTTLGIALACALSLGTAQAATASGQRCRAHKISTAPTANFKIDHKRSLVTQGELMWKRCAEGQTVTATSCEKKPGLAYFEDLMDKKTLSRFAGYSDWRLPTIEELKGIVEKQCRGPAMNLEVFPAAPNLLLWSSSKVPNRDDKAWVMFSSTGVAIKANIASTALVRLVRDVK